MNNPVSEMVDRTIRHRRTTKVFANENALRSLDKETLMELIEVAGWAPFHRRADDSHRQQEHDSSVPWRFYVLPKSQCMIVRDYLLQRNDQGKLPQMLAAASALINVTWLPNPSANSGDTEQLFDPTIGNMEHIAAASAAIQNLLIAATARGIPTYWSSGGAFRKPELFELLNISKSEVLLGSIFLFPDNLHDFEHVPGKLRDERGDTKSWVRWIKDIQS